MATATQLAPTGAQVIQAEGLLASLRRQRNQEIVDAVSAGENRSAVGRRYGLTPAGVYKILDAHQAADTAEAELLEVA